MTSSAAIVTPVYSLQRFLMEASSQSLGGSEEVAILLQDARKITRGDPDIFRRLSQATIEHRKHVQQEGGDLPEAVVASADFQAFADCVCELRRTNEALGDNLGDPCLVLVHGEAELAGYVHTQASDCSTGVLMLRTPLVAVGGDTGRPVP